MITIMILDTADQHGRCGAKLGQGRLRECQAERVSFFCIFSFVLEVLVNRLKAPSIPPPHWPTPFLCSNSHWSGAAVGVGMLRGAGDSFTWK